MLPPKAMLGPKNMILGYVAYLREHPDELVRIARSATKLRFGVPVAVLRWLVTQIDGDGIPKDVEIESAAPGIRVTATVEEMSTLLRGSAILVVQSVRFSERELRVEVRLEEVSVRLLDDQSRTPLAALIRSGALDLSRTANLVAHLPTRPAVLVEAIDNRLILDFMQIPMLARNERLRRVVGVMSTLLSVERVETDESHLDVALKALPQGLGALFNRS